MIFSKAIEKYGIRREKNMEIADSVLRGEIENYIKSMSG